MKKINCTWILVLIILINSCSSDDNKRGKNSEWVKILENIKKQNNTPQDTASSIGNLSIRVAIDVSESMKGFATARGSSNSFKQFIEKLNGGLFGIHKNYWTVTNIVNVKNDYNYFLV